ncbi:short-chain dehydrogenase reductase 3b-like [Camellia sinensis]|uniref:short-chain dehydrogenase reductase 3b-like n=1 Tax=Camellia sinensis TaxID=4442 RepID=UPI001035E83E|nr:short-chain dehydrogenase reductase 3b-like [Camellia sinensis]
MAANVRGVASTIKHAARAMVAKEIRGSIICTTSVAACLGGTGPHAYTASKHALVGLVRSACRELGHHGIRVNCVSPFGVATPLSCKAYNLEPSEVEANSCVLANLKGIVLKARHIAEAALFLASDELPSPCNLHFYLFVFSLFYTRSSLIFVLWDPIFHVSLV